MIFCVDPHSLILGTTKSFPCCSWQHHFCRRRDYHCSRKRRCRELLVHWQQQHALFADLGLVVKSWRPLNKPRNGFSGEDKEACSQGFPRSCSRRSTDIKLSSSRPSLPTKELVMLRPEALTRLVLVGDSKLQKLGICFLQKLDLSKTWQRCLQSCWRIETIKKWGWGLKISLQR